MLLTLLSLQLMTAGAAPAEGPAADASLQQDLSFEGSLLRAKEHYFAGDDRAALEDFQRLQLRLLGGEEVPWEQASDALIYLGELHMKAGDEAAAEDVFRYILLGHPDTPISPYAHPIDVVYLFGRVREQVIAEQQPQVVPPAPPVPPVRWHSYLPLGLPQLAEGRLGAGVLFAGGQVALGGTSLLVYRELIKINQPGFEHPKGWTDEEVTRRVNTQRLAVQWPTAAGFYGVWLWSSLEARHHWRANHRPQPQLSVRPTWSEGTGFQVAGRW